MILTRRAYNVSHISTNYPVCFLDCRILLQIFADYIFDLSKVLLNKRLFNVNHFAESINAHHTDGSSYHGDIIAGADGVLSKVRQEIWGIADAMDPGEISKREKDCEHVIR